MLGLELEGKAKIILLDKPLTLSENNYTISDILTTTSQKTGQVSVKIVLKDEYGRDLAAREVDSIMILSNDLDLSKVRVSNEKEKGFGISDTICKRCGGVVKTQYKHLNSNEDGEGGYNADISTCSRCEFTETFPD